MNRETEASEAMKFIMKWTPEEDVRAFHRGPSITMLGTCLSAAYVNYSFRRALKMKHYAFGTTYGAAVFIPSIAATMLHLKFAVEPLLVGSSPCAVCLEARSAAVQASCGVLYPMLLSPLACLQFVGQYRTMKLPSLRYQPLLLISKLSSLMKPFSKNLVILAAIQMVVGGCLAQWERSALLTVLQKVSVMEESVASHVSPEKMQQLKNTSSIVDFKQQLISAPLPDNKYFGGSGG